MRPSHRDRHFLSFGPWAPIARLVVSLFAATLVFVISRSALAAAPQCDARAATTFAPNPTLDSSKASVEATADDCANAATASDRVFRRGQSPSVSDASDATVQACVPALTRVIRASSTAALAHFAEAFTLPAGVHDRVERPPRA